MDDFLEKLEALFEAQADLAEKKKTCEIDAHYFLHREYERVSNLKKGLTKDFEAAVDARVRSALRSHRRPSCPRQDAGIVIRDSEL